ncbi:hypothetical protein BpHYR1_015918 [Brachionus plicatilis]|uniref:Uncharacterized protein n=1 Tax=Brachionus plicatilis TaxID=10195 RepID=A0A3M7R2N2_BRAPC|nr:hypothetical protein BpHYR1_015918 [Brachionus plicatilis]
MGSIIPLRVLTLVTHCHPQIYMSIDYEHGGQGFIVLVSARKIVVAEKMVYNYSTVKAKFMRMPMVAKKSYFHAIVGFIFRDKGMK